MDILNFFRQKKKQLQKVQPTKNDDSFTEVLLASKTYCHILKTKSKEDLELASAITDHQNMKFHLGLHDGRTYIAVFSAAENEEKFKPFFNQKILVYDSCNKMFSTKGESQRHFERIFDGAKDLMEAGVLAWTNAKKNLIAELMKRRAIDQKNSIEKLLSDAVTSQFDAVSKEIDAFLSGEEAEGKSASEVFFNIDKLPMLKVQIGEKLSSKVYNPKLEENFDEIQKLLLNGNLTEAHLNIFKMADLKKKFIQEATGSIEYNENLAEHYFSEVNELAQQLCKNVIASCHSTIDSVVSKEKGIEDFITDVVTKRVNEFQKKCDNDYGLINALFNFVTYDLKIVKEGIIPHLPERYKPLDQYILSYYTCVSKMLTDIAAKTDLRSLLIQRLITFAKLNSGANFLHPCNIISITESLNRQKPLLDADSIENLYKNYIDKAPANINDFFRKQLKLETESWNNTDKLPPQSHEEERLIYGSDLPLVLTDLLNAYLDLPSPIPEGVEDQLVSVILHQIYVFSNDINNAINEYMQKKFNDSDNKHFISTLIMIANNLQYASEIFPTQIHRHTTDDESLRTTESLKSLWIEYQRKIVMFLSEKIREEITEEMNCVFTPIWLQNSDKCNVICGLIQNRYVESYCFLRLPLKFCLLEKLFFVVASQYVHGIKDRKFLCTNAVEREKISMRLREDGQFFADTFSSLCKEFHTKIPCFLKQIANLLDCARSDLMGTTSQLLKSFPDVTDELVLKILCFREDIDSSEAGSIINEAKVDDINMKNFFSFCLDEK